MIYTDWYLQRKKGIHNSKMAETKGSELKSMFSSARMQEMKQNFDKYAKGKSIKCEDFGNVMKECGEDVAPYQLRKIISKVQSEKEGMISFDEFTDMFSKMSSKAVGGRYKHAIDSKKGVQKVEGDSSASAEGTRHSFSDDEQIGFSDWINSVLEDDPDLKGKAKITWQIKLSFFLSLILLPRSF